MADTVFDLLPQDLADRLLPWYEKNARPLPWRENAAPYRVWISEIMLQQTRIEAAKGYFLRFTEALPTVEALAAASEEQVLKLWEGLGYYSRARNLHKAAKLLAAQYEGRLPSDRAALRALPGIGDYTAGAIASIAFGLPEPAVDGNVLRVCARLTCCPDSIGDGRVRDDCRRALRERYPKTACGSFTSALMELGETVCLPGTPDCELCPLGDICAANRTGQQTDYPVMPEKKPRRAEQRTVFILEYGDSIALRQRPEKGLLAGLWEFPNVTGHISREKALEKAAAWGCMPLTAEKLADAVHIFTHIEWHMTGYRISCTAAPESFTWVGREALHEVYPIPTAFRAYKKLI